MNLLLSDVIWIALLIALAGLWWHGQGVKAHALKKVKSYCEEYNIQLLDESLVLRKFWLTRSTNGALCAKRTYYFEFTSTGEYRYRGFVVMAGYELLEVDAQTHHMQ